jgi:hypothetical protein
LLVELRAGRRHAGGGLHLTAAQLKLQLDSPALGLLGHRGVAGGRFAGPRVDEEELFLCTEGGPQTGRVAQRYQRAAAPSAPSAVG